MFSKIIIMDESQINAYELEEEIRDITGASKYFSLFSRDNEQDYD